MRTVAQSLILRFPHWDAGETLLLNSSNRFTAYSSYPIELKLGSKILDISPYNRSESNFPCSPRGRCWGAPFEIFESIHNLQYLSDWFGTWYDDTKLSIFTIGLSRIFGCRGGAEIFKIFTGRRLYMFSCLAVAEFSISSIWDMTAASDRRYFSL